MTKRFDRTRIVGTLVSVGVMGLSGLAVGAASSRSPAALQRSQAAGDAFWDALRIEGSEVENYAQLGDMAARADLVVVGKLANFRVSRQLQGDAAEDVVTYAAADVTIDDVVRGSAPGASVPVEFLLGSAPSDAPDVVAKQAARLPQGSALFLLRHKGGAERGLYRLVNSSGLWVEDARGLRAPLAEEPAAEAEVVPPAPNAAQTAEDSEALERARGEGKVKEIDPRLVEEIAKRKANPPPPEPPPADFAADDPSAKYAPELQAAGTLEGLANSLR